MEYELYPIENDELYHHGVKGMKWGVRRYQNKDGSLTAAGKKRRSEDGDGGSGINLSRDTSPETTKKAIKAGLLDKTGKYFTEKGHLSEVARRKKLTPDESDAEVKALCKDWFTDLDSPDYNTAVDRAARVSNEIYNFVGSWYEGVGHTERIDKIMREYEDYSSSVDWRKRYTKEWNQVVNPLKDRMSSEVLNELGYSNTEAGRKLIEPLWNDHAWLNPDEYLKHSALGEAFVADHLSAPTDELYHHGVKGMKWGVRRYQNKDGSLTNRGRIRYGAGKAAEGAKKVVKGAVEKYKSKRASAKESERIQKLLKKPIKKLTEAELAERTALATKQKNLRQIESDSNRMAENAKSFVSKFGSKMLNEALVPATVNAGKGAIEKLLSKKLSEALGLNEKDTTEALRKSVEALRLKKEKGELDKYFERGGKDDEATALRKSVETLRLKKEKGDLEKALSGKDDTKEADAKLAEDAARASNQVKLATAKKTLKKLAEEEAEEEEKKKKNP